MVRNFERLFSPIKIGSLELKNRVMKTPAVSGLATEDGWVTAETKERYKREALGGLGAIALEPVVIQPSKSTRNIRLSDDRFIPGVKQVVDLMRAQDSELKIGVQFVHFFKVARSGWRQKLEDLTLEDLEKGVQYHVDAAKRVVEAGFDFLELHMAHITVSCSMLSLLNQRTDEYGGTFEGRMKYPAEVFRAVRAAVGADFPLAIRMDGEEFVLGGNTLLQTPRIAKRFAEIGADYISVSAGDKYEDAPPPLPNLPIDSMAGYSGSRMSPPWYHPDGANVYLAAAIREYLRKAGLETPILIAGKIRTPQYAEQILGEGKADIIGMARALICDPDWARKAQEGRDNEIVRCAACNYCVEADGRLEPVMCARWPEGVASAPAPFLAKQARPAVLPKSGASE